MTRHRLENTSDCQTCFCCMCRCGDHKCLQQLALKLPLSMQNLLKSDGKDFQKRKEEKEYVCESDLYRGTTYKRDFCEKRDIIDIFPLEQKKPEANLKIESGCMAKDSTYKNDFIPWSRGDQELCRAKLHVPDHILNEAPGDGISDTQEPNEKISDELRNYYCPPHCIGDGQQKSKNCLIEYKEKFNLGPSYVRKESEPFKPYQPFETFTNYRLDYKGCKLSPRKKEKKNGLGVKKTLQPMASETSYQYAFTYPPEIQSRLSKQSNGKCTKDQQGTLTVGDGPMLQQTTSMLDYQDPDVSVHKPVRPPRDAFQPPACRMESTTSTGSAYPRWKHLPCQDKPKQKATVYKQHQDDIRRSITTYQEDFDGLNLALCPCKVAVKYGSKVLEPRYYYTESEKLHDIFRYDKNISKPKIKECPH